MRTLLLSDIHGNLPAFKAVMSHASKQGFDRVFFLGDAVGYYPDGDAVVGALRKLNAQGVLGNHDAWMLAPEWQTSSGYIFDILNWQRAHMRPENTDYLLRLPWHHEGERHHMVHGSPCDPMTYIDELEVARQAFTCTAKTWIFHGHTHLAGAFLALEGPNGPWIRYRPFTKEKTVLALPPRGRILVNPGSVGQPRDGLPLAAYAIWDEASARIEAYRVAYDLEAVRRRLADAGFPLQLYERLKVGR